MYSPDATTLDTSGTASTGARNRPGVPRLKRPYSLVSLACLVSDCSAPAFDTTRQAADGN